MNYKSLLKGLFNGVFIFILTGCSVVTPVNDLALPPVSIIEGTVIQLDKNGFELRVIITFTAFGSIRAETLCII